ncbi:hypothetical protein CBL_11544 [Carabus blaptoides fortunei]
MMNWMLSSLMSLYYFLVRRDLQHPTFTQHPDGPTGVAGNRINFNLHTNDAIASSNQEKPETFAELLDSVHNTPTNPVFDNNAFHTYEQLATENINYLQHLDPSDQSIIEEEVNLEIALKKRSTPGDGCMTFSTPQ